MSELISNRYKVVVSPERGGLITRLEYRSKRGRAEILRLEPSTGGIQDNLPLFGCFPMVPFSNRLSKPELPLGSSRALFRPNWSAEEIAMHGVGFLQVWSLDQLDHSLFSMSTSVKDVTGCFLGRSCQSIRLSDDRGLLVSLSYQHENKTPMPVGLGLHPWFFAPKDEIGINLEFEATGKFEMSSDHFPMKHLSYRSKRWLFSPGDNGLDTCFTGWSGYARLNRPSSNLSVEIFSNAKLLHCFISNCFESICMEPVSHVPNVIHDDRWKEMGEMKLLQTGDRIQVEMQVMVRNL